MFQRRKVDWLYKILSRLVYFSAFLVTLWDFVQIQEITIRLSLVNVTGGCLFLIGICLRVVAIRTLGKYFLTDLKTLQDHRLIKQGIYKHIRHPAYLGTLIFSIGIPLIFSSLYGFLLILALFPIYLYRIRIEESMLLKEFGDEYLEYMKKTRKIIPFIY